MKWKAIYPPPPPLLEGVNWASPLAGHHITTDDDGRPLVIIYPWNADQDATFWPEVRVLQTFAATYSRGYQVSACLTYISSSFSTCRLTHAGLQPRSAHRRGATGSCYHCDVRSPWSPSLSSLNYDWFCPRANENHKTGHDTTTRRWALVRSPADHI